MKVIWHPDALETLSQSFNYIKEHSPQNARLVVEQLLYFGEELKLFPDKFPLCRKSVLRRRKIHCVTYLNHTFVYRTKNKELHIFTLFHASQHPRKLKIK